MKKIFLVFILIIASGCVNNWISKQSRALADRNVSFSMLTENPEAYQGKLVMLGGTIIAVKQEKESTQYLVLEYKLDKWNRPDRSVPSSGIFIATTSKAIDPVAYKPGTLITTFGKVIGSRTQQFNEVLHVCPVVAIREIHEIVAPRWDYYGLGGL